MGELARIWSGLTLKQKISLLLASCAVVAGVWWLNAWNRDRDMRPLFTGVAAEDAGAVLERLRSAEVDYKVSDSGTAILVPSARVAELRLQMASAGLPRTGRVGFELFDKPNLGATEFAEQVNYRRALEGELERSVMALAEVDRARVHVTFPKESVYLEARQPAKASVLVKLHAGRHLSSQNVAAIAHLASSAVEGLAPEGVSILDMDGNLLSKPRLDPGGEGVASAPAAQEYRQSIERDLKAKLQTTLDPLLGPDKYRTGVTVDCDFTSGEQSEETFDPAKSVMAQSQKTEDVSGGSASAGVPGAASSLPRPTSRPGQGGNSVARRTESITYQTSRVVRRVKIPLGTVKKISVAVLVDQDVRWEGKGPQARRVLTPPPPEKLKVIKDLVSGIAGIQTDRGDQVLVETLPFDTTLRQAPPETQTAPPAPPAPVSPYPGWWPAQLRSLPAVIGAAVALVLVLLGLPLMLILRRKGARRPAAAARPAALAAGSAPAGAISAAGAAAAGDDFASKARAQIAQNEARVEAQEMEMLASLKLPTTSKKSEVLKKQISESAKKDPVATAQLVRTWLNERER